MPKVIGIDLGTTNSVVAVGKGAAGPPAEEEQSEGEEAPESGNGQE